MPLPKDPKKVKEWKRRVGLKTMLGRSTQYGLRVVSPPTIKIQKDMNLDELSNVDIIHVHAKLHMAYVDPPRGWDTEELVNLHSALIKKMKERSIKHTTTNNDLDDIEIYMGELDESQGEGTNC